MPTTTHFHLRGLPADLWHRARVEALRRQIPVGELVSMALAAYLATLAKKGAKP